MERKSLLKLFIIGVVATFTLGACEKDDNINSGSESLTCKIDGVDFTATIFNNSLMGDATAKRLDIRGTDKSGTQLIITVNDVEPIGTNFSHLGDTVYADVEENTPMGIMTLGTMMLSDGSVLMTIGDGVKTGFSIITSCDLTNKKVSGKFEFMFVDFQSNDTIYVTEGEFSNLTYLEF